MKGGGAISFIPLGTQKAAGGEIAEDGTYTVTTNNPGDGAMVGEYRVAIHQVTDKEGERVADGEKSKAGAATTVAPVDRIPAIVGDHYNSPVTAKVEAKIPNEINFDLKRQ